MDNAQQDGSNDLFENDLLKHLEALEAKLERSEETIHAQVLTEGNGLQILRLLESADIHAGATDEITITGVVLSVRSQVSNLRWSRSSCSDCSKNLRTTSAVALSE